MSLGTNIAIMNHGVIQQYDTPENIYNKPNNTFVADFIGSPSMNLISGQLVKNANNTSFIPEGSNQSNNISIKNYDFVKPINENNKEVFFCIRPEHIFHNKTNENDFGVKMQSELNEYIGHEQIITFNYCNQEVLGKFPSTVKIETGKEMKLFFDLSQISIFDKKTNNRI
jgi:multiple sugar transport system ATP-binding protein